MLIHPLIIVSVACGLNCALAAPQTQDMVINGAVMRFDTKTNITTAEGGEGWASAKWGNESLTKTLRAKRIQARLYQSTDEKPEATTKIGDETQANTAPTSVTKATTPPSKSLSRDIENIEAEGSVVVIFSPNAGHSTKNNQANATQTLTADRCHSEGQKIICEGTVTLSSHGNTVCGTRGVFDLEHDVFEVSATPGQQASVHLRNFKKASAVVVPRENTNNSHRQTAISFKRMTPLTLKNPNVTLTTAVETEQCIRATSLYNAHPSKYTQSRPAVFS